MAKIAKFRSVEARRNSETGKFKGPKLLEPPSVKTWGRLLIPAPPKPCILRCFHYVKRPTTISPLLAGLLSLYTFRKKKKKKKNWEILLQKNISPRERISKVKIGRIDF